MGGQNSGKPEGYGKQVKIEPVLKLLENKYLETKDVKISFVEEVKSYDGDYNYEDVKNVFLKYKDVISYKIESIDDKTSITFFMEK